MSTSEKVLIVSTNYNGEAILTTSNRTLNGWVICHCSVCDKAIRLRYELGMNNPIFKKILCSEKCNEIYETIPI